MQSTTRNILLGVLCILSCLQPVLVYAQETPSPEVLEQKVKRYLGWMNDPNKPDIWFAASRLEKLGKEIVPILKRECKQLSEPAQVACAKVLIVLNDAEYALQLLVQIVEKGQDTKAKMDAVGLLGIYGDYELEDKLLQAMETALDPYVKITLAKTVWQISRNPQATKRLREFLTSDNAEIRFSAALALGEVQNVEAAKMVLAELKDEPSLRGRLAKSLLDREALVNRYERLMLSQKNQPAPSRYPVIEEVLEKIKEYHVEGDKLDMGEMVDEGVKGIVSASDMHSAFWNEKEWADFTRTTLKEEYVGIGVYVGDRNGYFTVIAPIYSGPAYRAGIRSMDRIIEVNDWSTTGKPVDDIINRIRGEQGTVVKLKIYREGWSKVREIEVKRESIQVPSLFSQMLPEKIGYIRLTQFGGKATEHMESALLELSKDGMKSLVLDLRGNAGGWLKAAVDIVDLFLEGGKLIVYSQGRHPVKGKKYEYYSADAGTQPNYPMVILVDQSSASASEIVAGTLQHYQRAVLVGNRTYGKGSVQEPLELTSRPGTRLKLTIAKYYLPDGRCIHNLVDKSGKTIQHNGIDPEIKVNYGNWEPWKNEEYTKLDEKQVFKKYLEEHYETNKQLFARLADHDDLQTKEYPKFDEWYATLGTKASAQDVREWLRANIRLRVADERGREFACDYMEDIMLQRAIVELCKKLNVKIAAVTEFQTFSQKFNEKPNEKPDDKTQTKTEEKPK